MGSYCLTHETNSSFAGEKNRRIERFGQCLIRLMRRSLTEGSKAGRFSAIQIINRLSQELPLQMLGYYNPAPWSRHVTDDVAVSVHDAPPTSRLQKNSAYSRYLDELPSAQP